MTIKAQPRPRGWFPGGFTAMCDVCGKLRRHGNHDKCAKARQAAGFLDDVKPESEV